MVSTSIAGAVGGLLAAGAVVVLAAWLGDASALATVWPRATGDGSTPGAGVTVYLGYGVVAGGAFGALAAWLGFEPTTGALVWLLGGVAWSVVLFLVGVAYRGVAPTPQAAIPLRRALGYDLVFGVVLGGVVGALA